MKRIMIAVLAALLALLCMAGAVAEEDGCCRIVATTYPLYDMARSICGDLVEIQYAPEDAETIVADADVVLCIGAEDDAWVYALADVKVVKAVDGLELIEGNTDVLTSPVNCMICAAYFTDAMAKIDPENISTYQSNLNAYVETMSVLDGHIREIASEGMKIRCADGSMAYFAREYGLTEAQDDEDATELSTYNIPAEELLETAYAELMYANLKTLAGSED